MLRRIVPFLALLLSFILLLVFVSSQLNTQQASAAGEIAASEALQALAYGRIISDEPAVTVSETDDQTLLPLVGAKEEMVHTANQSITGMLAYSSNRHGAYDVFAQSITGIHASSLVQGVGNQVTPAWSPDGTQMLYASDQDGDFEIYLYTAAGQHIQLTNNTFEDLHPSWSPDGQQILFSSNRSGYFQAYTLPVTGGTATRIGVIENNVLWPHFSPDGEQIAFMRASIILPACDWNWDVWTMDKYGGSQTRITTWLGGDLFPNWSPDGKIVYSSCRNFLTADLYLMDPVTGINTQISAWTAGSELDPAYSPDGAYLAFTSNVTGSYEIYFAPSNGGDAVNLSVADGDDIAPSWQPTSDQTGPYAISGWLLDTLGDPISGAAVSAGGHTTTSASDGSFLLTNLAAGLYTVTPDQSDLYFSPTSRVVTVPPNREDLFFVATDTPCPNSLSGQVIDRQDNSFIEGAAVTVWGRGPEETALTNAAGYYAFSNLPAGLYQIRVEKTGYETETSLMLVDGDSVCDIYNPRLTPIITYLGLAEHYAPVWYQDVDMRDADADFITNFNFDGNWNGADNWQNQNDYPLKSYIYYTVLETESHWYIHYADFHPRDWGPELGSFCTGESIPWTNTSPCHENDMEGVLVAVKKNGEPYGEFHFMETVFHLGFEKYTNDTNISGADGTVLFYQNTHPRIYVQPVGHGVKAYDGMSFEDRVGVIYYYRAGNPTEPPPMNQRQVVTAYYDLVPISGELWNRRFDFLVRDGQQTYQDWGTFASDEHQIGAGAHPPWGWDDVLNVLHIQTGDFFFNPAYVGQIHLSGLGYDFSQSYVYNPYCFADVTVLPNESIYLLSVDGRIQLLIPPGSTADEIVLRHSNNCNQVHASPSQYTAGYDEINETAAIRAAAETDHNQIVVGHTFLLEAQTSADQTPVTTLAQPYELQFRYSESDVAKLYEESLTLYWWDGSGWVAEPSSQVDLRENVVRALPRKLGLFVVMGIERHLVHLPVMMKSP